MAEHNDDFDRSLTERLRAHESHAPGGAAPNLDAIDSGASSRRPTGWGWGALVGAGGGAAGLLLVLAISGRLAPPTGEASPTPHPMSSTSETPAPSASTAPSPPVLSVIPIAGLTSEDEIRAIVELGGRLFGVGRHGDQGAVWTSLEGAAWTLARDLPAEQADSNAATTMTSIVAGPGGLVAAGSRTGIDYSAPRTWQSADGQRWTSITVPSGGAGGRIEALAVGGPGYVMVGLVSDDGYTGRPQMWTSADGREWVAVDNQLPTGSLNDVTGGAGMLVGVGATEGHAVALVSTDGATWTAAPEQETLQGAEMTSVTFRNGTLVATGLLLPGQAGLATPVIWSSSDGLHWTLVLRGGPGQLIRQVVSTDAGFVAIGGDFPSRWWQYDPAAPNPPRDTVQLWFSADGETWSGPTTGFLADGGVTLGRPTLSGGDLLVPITLLNAGPSGPVSQSAILRGALAIR